MSEVSIEDIHHTRTTWTCEDCGAEHEINRHDDFPSVTVEVPMCYPNVQIRELERPLCSECESLNYFTDDDLYFDSGFTDTLTRHAIKPGDINRLSVCSSCHGELSHTSKDRQYCSDPACDGLDPYYERTSERRFILTLEKHWYTTDDYRRFKAFVLDVRREYPELFTPEATPVRLDDLA